jgi:hypothetical protein
VALPQGRKLLSTPGQDLVDIALVPGVEDDRIARRVKDPVHRKRELDHSEVGSEVAAGLAHVLDQERTNLQTQLLQLICRQGPQVLWAMDRAQQSVRGG